MSDYKNNWIAALRSGKYKQGQAALCVEDECGARRYCCLGVLAQLDGVLTQERETHIVEPDYIGVKQFGWLESPVEPGCFSGPICNESMYAGVNRVLDRIMADPPEDVGDLTIGESWSLPYVVANLNDNGWSFERIADYLETVDF